MKAAVVTLLGIFFTISAFAQGTVHFANTASPTFRLTTNSTATPPPGQLPNQTGFTMGPGHYGIGLYIAPDGTTDFNAFTLIATTENLVGGLGAGYFDGGTVAIPNVGGPIAFQVRAWSLFAGTSFEQARSAPGLPYLGFSTIGSIPPGASNMEIFGAGPGQVGAFVLTPVPEPSTYALILLGLGVGRIFLKRRTVPQR